MDSVRIAWTGWEEIDHKHVQSMRDCIRDLFDERPQALTIGFVAGRNDLDQSDGPFITATNDDRIPQICVWVPYASIRVLFYHRAVFGREKSAVQCAADR